MYINNEYVRRGDIDPRKLLAQEDVTKLVAELLPQVQSNLNKMGRRDPSKKTSRDFHWPPVQ